MNVATVESLSQIEGVGQKTAEKLVERAAAMVARLEAEYDERHAAEVAAAGPELDGKLSEQDVFEDSPDFVSEVDDVREVQAPDLGDIEDEDEDETRVQAADDEEAEE